MEAQGEKVSPVKLVGIAVQLTKTKKNNEKEVFFPNYNEILIL